MNRSWKIMWIVTLGLACLANAAAPTTKPVAPEKVAPVDAPRKEGTKAFMRFVENPDQTARLEVADAAYRDAKGRTVHLVGAVHIADKRFFDALNESFRHYDSVLYEMVRNKQDNVPRPNDTRRPTHWIGSMQRFMTTKLDLSYQLDIINYRAKNMVHADMTADEFVQRQEERGETFFQIFLRSYETQLDRGPAAMPFGIMDLVNALQDPQGARDLKFMFGKAMSTMDEQLAGIEGEDGSVILTERNQTAFKVLKQRLGKGDKYLAVFYGAAHLSGMQDMLYDMGFKRVDVAWRTAWEVGRPVARNVPVSQPSKK